MNKPMISFAIALIMTAGAAHAERNVHRHSFAVDKTRTSTQGTITRHTEQVARDNGFTRTTTATNIAGNTATRNVNVTNDKESMTRARDVSGTTFGGKNYTKTAVTQKTADGYSRSSNIVGPNGKTASRTADVVVDKAAGSAAKTIVKTAPDGTQTTVVKQITRTSTETVQ